MKQSKIRELVIQAGVEGDDIENAVNCLLLAQERAKGTTWAKWKVRLFKAKQISEMLEWEDERLLDRYPDKAEWDIEPMVNITAHGDNVPWQEPVYKLDQAGNKIPNPSGDGFMMLDPGGYPVPGVWLNKDPLSDEYKKAIIANYWSKGNHPRSKQSRKDWYRRNGGAYVVSGRGMPVDLTQPVRVWSRRGVLVVNNNGAWQLVAQERLLGFMYLNTSIGFELKNAIGLGKSYIGDGSPVANPIANWKPIPGYPYNAPVTFTRLPGFKKAD